ncbi:MAG: hypothetical protein IJT95_05370 [Abditibacteriota bacterium]|nr:hypothetical protein [Abditibacteriota bacterium]
MKRFYMLLAAFILALAVLPAALQARDIADVDGLLELCGDTVEENIVLTAPEYDLTGRSWRPIAELAEGFEFDGNGAVIKGLDMSSRYGQITSGKYGLIAVNNGTVKDLNIRLTSDSESGKYYAGPVAAENYGTISGCRVFGDADDPVTLVVSTCYAGGIAGSNIGTIEDCSVNDISFATSGSKSFVGGIAGQLCGGEINGCTVYNVSILINNSADAGGIAGVIEESPYPSADLAKIKECSVLYSSLSGDGGNVGGLAGNARLVEATDCRVNYVDLRHTGSGVCNIGGLFGEVTVFSSEPVLIKRCYYADVYSANMHFQTGDNAGGIVGLLSADDGTREIFKRCIYCSDFTDVTDVWGMLTDNASAYNFTECYPDTKADMTSDGWAELLLGEGWTNNGPDGYPVYSDMIPVSFARLHRGDDYLSRSSYRLAYDGVDVTELGLVDPAMEFDPELFAIPPFTDMLPVVIEYVTVNGEMITGPVTAGDYGQLTFSAVVDNEASSGILQPALDEAVAIYDASAGYYSPESRAELKSAIDDVRDILDDEYLYMTTDRANDLADSLRDIEMDKFLYSVTFDADHSAVYRYSEGEWTETNVETGLFGDELLLKAVPDDSYRFLYWADSAGNKLSEDPELTYSVSRTTTLTAVVAPEASFDFIYKDTYGKIYKIQPVTDYSELAYPAEVGSTGLRTGYTVKAWTNDYEGDLPASGEVTGDVTFTASLTKNQTTYQVFCSVAGEEETLNLRLAAVYSKTAPDEYEGNAFCYWRDSDSGSIISYGKTLKVSVYSDMNLEAIYSGTPDDVTVAVLQTPIVSSGKISFTGQVVMGGDFATEIMHGVLLLKSNDDPVTQLVLDTPGVIVGKSSGYSAVTKTFIINKKNVADGDTWYGRAFVVYKDSGGIEKIAYSDIKSATM